MPVKRQWLITEQHDTNASPRLFNGSVTAKLCNMLVNQLLLEVLLYLVFYISESWCNQVAHIVKLNHMPAKLGLHRRLAICAFLQ